MAAEDGEAHAAELLRRRACSVDDDFGLACSGIASGNTENAMVGISVVGWRSSEPPVGIGRFGPTGMKMAFWISGGSQEIF